MISQKHVQTRPYLGPSEAIFPWTEKIENMHLFCLFSRCGALAAIHPVWGNRYFGWWFLKNANLLIARTTSYFWVCHWVVHQGSSSSSTWPQTGWIGPIGPPREIGRISTCFAFFWPMEKFAWNCPNWGLELFFPTNPDLADILGDMDFDFENLYF